MKRTTCKLTLIGLFLPLALAAQVLPSLVAYDNDSKTVFIEWIEEGINNGKVLFDTQEHKDEFLSTIQVIYGLRDAEDWNGIVTKAEELQDYTQYILVPMVSDNKRELAASLCNLLKTVYQSTFSALVGITPDDQDATIESMTTDDNNVRRLVVQMTVHFVNCSKYTKRNADGSPKIVHAEGCEEITTVGPL